MEIVVGILITLVNQLLLFWRITQLERRNIVNPGKILGRAKLSMLERLLLVGTLLVLAMIKLDPLWVVASFFITNLGFIFYRQWQQTH
jgi:hypothetical protein